MKNVHGKFNSFAELGKALGIKVPQNVQDRLLEWHYRLK